MVAVYFRVEGLSKVFGAIDQYEIMMVRKSVDSGWVSFFLNKLIVKGVLWILFLHLILKRNISEKIPSAFNPLIWIFVLFYVIYSFASFQKISVVYFIISVIVAANYHRVINLSTIFRSSIYFLVFMFGIYYLLVKNIGFSYMLSPFEQGLIGRIFISEIGSLYPHFSLFGDDIPHIGFLSLSSSLSEVLGSTHMPRSGEMVMANVNPHWIEMGIGGTYNTLFIGEAYANFGWSGVVFSIIWVPIYYVLIATYIRKFLHQVFSRPLYILLVKYKHDVWV
jgi:hypothetical protein